MVLIKICSVFIVFLLTMSPALSAIYKCPSDNGTVIFSQTPCPNGFKKEQGKWNNIKEKEKLEKEKERIKKQKEISKIKQLEIAIMNQKKEVIEIAKIENEKEQIRQKKIRIINKKEAKRFKKTNPEIAPAISDSDDYVKYELKFLKASKHLLDRNICTLEELKYIGGWVKSYNYYDEPEYFTYCGSGKRSAAYKFNKIYFNAINEVFTFSKYRKEWWN